VEDLEVFVNEDALTDAGKTVLCALVEVQVNPALLIQQSRLCLQHNISIITLRAQAQDITLILTARAYWHMIFSYQQVTPTLHVHKDWCMLSPHRDWITNYTGFEPD